MFKVSIPAAARMTNLLGAKEEDAVLRIVRRDGRFRLKVSQMRPGDQTFVHGGRIVLVLDERTNESLSRRFLDIKHTDAGPRLKIAAR